MKREECKVGMSVTFGRNGGEKTEGVVVKMNPTKAKVQITIARGRTPVGCVWSVPYSLMSETGSTPPSSAPMPAAEWPLGLAIKEIRPMTTAELEAEGWGGCFVTAFVLSDGSVVYPSRDEEGNSGGAFFGTKSGRTLAITA